MSWRVHSCQRELYRKILSQKTREGESREGKGAERGRERKDEEMNKKRCVHKQDGVLQTQSDRKAGRLSQWWESVECCFILLDLVG